MLISHNPNYYTPDSAYNSLSGNKSNSDWLSLGLSYVKKLDSLDSKISSDLDFSMRNSTNHSLNQVDYYTYKYGNNQDVFDSIYRSQGYKRETENNTKNISWRIDYFKPITKQMCFEAGFKTNITVITIQRFLVLEHISTTLWRAMSSIILRTSTHYMQV